MLSNVSEIKIIIPDWPAPENINACTTTRVGGNSVGMYQGMNLAAHVGDDVTAVELNRSLLKDQINLPTEPFWLQQIHSNNITTVTSENNFSKADGAVTDNKNIVCAVLTADCLPVLLCDKSGKKVMAVHAGWRGLDAGIIHNAVTSMNVDPQELLVWMGPAISGAVYEVGIEVYNKLSKTELHKNSFERVDETHWLCDLVALATVDFNQCGIDNIYGGKFCTFQQKSDFYSYRRDGECGRMASLIWME